MHYPNPLRAKYEPDAKQVVLSVQISDDLVLVKRVPLSEFQVMVAQVQAQLDEATSAKPGE